MKITFEGKTFGEIFDQMNDVMMSVLGARAKNTPVEVPAIVKDPFEQGPGPAPEVTDLSGKAAPAKVVADAKAAVEADAEAEKIRKRNENLAKGRATRDANKKAAAAGKPAPKKVEPEEPAAEEPPKEKPSPVDMVAIRTKTVAELQSAYANGKHAEVLELLSRFGNGAKSFRELPAEAFGPIREAIDLGALT